MTPFALGTLAVLLGAPIVALIYLLEFRRNRVHRAGRGLDLILKKRFDLIPNVVAAIQQHMTHARETLAHVTALRNQAMHTMSRRQKLNIEHEMTGIAGRLLLTAESYPQLKVDVTFLHLKKTLHDTETQIATARRAYTAAVKSYNKLVRKFPTRPVATLCGFKKEVTFSARSEASSESITQKIA